MYVNVELDGKPRRLRYQYNDIADVEEKAGLGIAAIFNEDRIGFHSIRLLIWGGLKWADHGLTSIGRATCCRTTAGATWPT